MQKYLLIMTSLILFSCQLFNDAAKTNDLQSPCAGCEDRTYPLGNIKYIKV